MSLVVGSGYTLSYLDHETGKRVEVPVEDVHVALPEHGGYDPVVVYDEVGGVSEETWERAKRYCEEHDLKRVVVVDMPTELHCTMELKHVDMVAVDRMVRSLRRNAGVVQLTDLRTRVRDWHDHGRQHRNRKKRSWRR